MRRVGVVAIVGALVALLVGAFLFVRSDDDDDGDDGAAPAEGAVTVQLEQNGDAVFIEGFEVGLRFETGDGDVIDSTLWTDFVEASGATELDDYYDSVLTQPVPAGTVVVRAEVSIGEGPPPVPPDLGGELACSLPVEVAPDQTVAVEVLFDEDGSCLRRLDRLTTATSR